MHGKLSMARGSKAVRKDPACGTCRKKCRKCDRTRPTCNRCKSKGLKCEGYPPRFQFCESPFTAVAANDSKARQREEPISQPSRKPERCQDRSSPSAQSPQTSISTDSRSAQVLHYLSHQGTSPDASTSPHNISVGQPSPISFSERHFENEPLTALNRDLLSYFDKTLSQHLTIVVNEAQNPFRLYVLPLAYQHVGVLHAVLGLAACHMSLSTCGVEKVDMATALQHRVAALNALSSLLIKEEIYGLLAAEEDAVLAIILLLVLHDICEMGISAHAVHLTGVSFLCDRVAIASSLGQTSSASMFFLSALAWLDVLRGFSGAEKLTYSESVRLCVVADPKARSSFHTLVGCPPAVFHRIGDVIAAAKRHQAKTMTLNDFEQVLQDAEVFFRNLRLEELDYPSSDAEWRDLADAYRHACLLRVIRWPDTFSIPCESDKVKVSVSAILDASSRIPMSSPFHKRLLFPLFLAAVDTSTGHQMHYATLCIQQIKRSTGFEHAAMTEVLEKVWEARANHTRVWPNIPWMEFTCSEALKQQHAYLFF
ncbi:hypothetical protein CKAH01_17207 [Colletotrichum kahawae]|uniref:Zn(2)-C6 fungal-type domain-containing protein n=1 Tax=Colletotrichum kahawae TaxID=34407 RepID=A0AAE0D773_COLKA|nr:hypothetical protein CKAH01_17207 [Colletotrichum kahawae]